MAALGFGKKVEAGEGEVVDVDGERGLGGEAERLRERRADGAAMGDGYEVPARVLAGQAPHRRRHARHQPDEALPTRRGYMGGRQPERMEAVALLVGKLRVLDALPLAEMLLGELGLH